MPKKKEDVAEKPELTPEQIEEAKKAREGYYDAAQNYGFNISQAMIHGSRVAQYAGSPHFRAVAGFTMMDVAIAELKDSDEEAAKRAFNEVVQGVYALGERLGYERKDSTKDEGK